MSDGAERRMVVEAFPTPPLEVVEPDLLLEFLVVALDAPAELREEDEPLDRDVGVEVREEELRRLLFVLRPLVEEPLLLSRRVAVNVPVGGAHAHRAADRALAPSAPLSPRNRAALLPSAGLGEFEHRKRLLIARQMPCARATGRGLRLAARRDRARSRSPHANRARHANNVRVAAVGERLAEVRDLAVPRVSQHDVVRDAPALGGGEQIERDLPLGLERDRLRDPCLLPAVVVPGPGLR